jgi:TolA-binding protein
MTVIKLFLCLSCATSAAAQTPEAYARAEAKAFKVRGEWAGAEGKENKFYLRHDFSLDEPAWKGQGTPEDSTYKSARESLNRGEYRRASEQFRSFEQKYPKSRYVPAALYWQAFALYRVGATTDLKQALGVLDDQRTRYPQAAAESEVTSLTTRVVGALAARGDSEARSRPPRGRLATARNRKSGPRR